MYSNIAKMMADTVVVRPMHMIAPVAEVIDGVQVTYVFRVPCILLDAIHPGCVIFIRTKKNSLTLCFVFSRSQSLVIFKKSCVYSFLVLLS